MSHRTTPGMPLTGLLALLLISIGCSTWVGNAQSATRLSLRAYSAIAWSPDGSRFFAVGSPSFSDYAQLFLVDATSGEETQLTEAPGRYSFPRWSPDGSSLAMTVNFDEIHLFKPATRQETLLTTGEASVWLNDGNTLAIYVGGLSSLWPDQREVRLVSKEGDAQEVVFAGPVIHDMLAVATAAARATPDFLTPSAPLPREYVEGMTWIRTEETLLFTIRASTSGSVSQQAVLVDLNSPSYVAFPGEQNIGEVASSPDGTLLAYVRLNGLGLGEALVIADVSGDCLSVLELAEGLQSPTWSPDGSRIAFLIDGRIHVRTLAKEQKAPKVPAMLARQVGVGRLTTRWSRPGQLRQNGFKLLSRRWPGGSSRGR